MYTLGQLVAAAAPAYWVFCLAYLLMGLAGNAIYVSGYVIGKHFVGFCINTYLLVNHAHIFHFVWNNECLQTNQLLYISAGSNSI